MQEELFIAIGRLYVEASRYQAMTQQLQETVQKQQSELNQLRSKLTPQSVVPPNATAQG